MSSTSSSYDKRDYGEFTPREVEDFLKKFPSKQNEEAKIFKEEEELWKELDTLLKSHDSSFVKNYKFYVTSKFAEQLRKQGWRTRYDTELKFFYINLLNRVI